MFSPQQERFRWQFFETTANSSLNTKNETPKGVGPNTTAQVAAAFKNLADPEKLPFFGENSLVDFRTYLFSLFFETKREETLRQTRREANCPQTNAPQASVSPQSVSSRTSFPVRPRHGHHPAQEHDTPLEHLPKKKYC